MTVLSGRDALRRLGSFPTFTSGSASIDNLLGGGYRAGRIFAAYGRSATGKSQLAMQAVLCASRAGSKSLFIDTEGGFRPERLAEMAHARGWREPGLLERIVYLRCDSAAEQAEVVRKMARREQTSGCRMVAVDTLTRNFSLELPGTANMPDRQGSLDAHISEMARDAFLNGRAYLLTNRVTFGGADQDVGVGGRTVFQLVHATLYLKKEGGAVRVVDEASGKGCTVGIGELGIE